MRRLPIAGSGHSGRWEDHNRWVLGLLQRHLRLHRPGRLLRPHGQERLETLNCWINCCLVTLVFEIMLKKTSSVTLVSWYFCDVSCSSVDSSKNNVNVYYAIIILNAFRSMINTVENWNILIYGLSFAAGDLIFIFSLSVCSNKLARMFFITANISVLNNILNWICQKV